MSWKAMKLAACSTALLLSAATAPAAALSLSVLPAQPVEDAPFILVASVNAACPVPASIVVTPGFPDSLILVTLVEACSTPAQPRLVQVPLGPLADGSWILRVRFGNAQAEVQTQVQPLPFKLFLDPAFPQAGNPIALHLTGIAGCPVFDSMQQDGNLLSLHFEGECNITPPPPGFIDLEKAIGPLPAGDYVVQVTRFDGQSFLSHRFHVFGAAECVPSETVLCLQGGRFRISATWRTASAQGAAKVRSETADSGSLWFFLPDNLELLVKVLDDCQSAHPHYWVFAAGLTNVEVDIAVTDTATQTTRHYRNPLDTSFAPVLDTAAFDCAPPNP
jgi:hypothetical protein